MKGWGWLAIGLAACDGKAGTGETGTPTDGGTTPTTPTGTPTTSSVQAYHTKGWIDPAVHGLRTKLQNGIDDQGGDCRDCHGADLEGDGDAVACSSCHGVGWTTDCTFCHGDPADGTGAPPRDISNETKESKLSFPEHRRHVDEGTIHADYDCSLCHDKPDSALFEGHVFDDSTAGRAEVHLFGAGASYDQGTQTCTVYCHGDGTGKLGSIAVSDGPVNCSSCHESSPTTGHHTTHKLQGIQCDECHADVDSSGSSITDPTPHVDGTRSVSLPTGMAFTEGSATCDGTCHNEHHSNRHWF